MEERQELAEVKECQAAVVATAIPAPAQEVASAMAEAVDVARAEDEHKWLKEPSKLMTGQEEN